MKVKFVTLTGADDRTSIDDLLSVSEQYSFVEWGILFSKSRQGQSGYPSWSWIDGLCLFDHLRLSAHLCGQWVTDSIRGSFTFLEEHENVDRVFSSIQINCYKDLLRQAIDSPSLWRNISMIHNGYKSTILGGDYSKVAISVDEFLNAGVYPLYDASGGNGLSPEKWPVPFRTEHGTPLFCGYAGGLGAHNICSELVKIEEAVGDTSIWIDMQSGVRTNDCFDLSKCRKVLHEVGEWNAR
jgi:hypothetical protein